MRYRKDAIERPTPVDGTVDAADRIRKVTGAYAPSRPLAGFAQRLRRAQTSHPPESPEAKLFGKTASAYEVASRIAPARKPRTIMKRKTGQQKPIDEIVKLADQVREKNLGTSGSKLAQHGRTLRQASQTAKSPQKARGLRLLGVAYETAAQIPAGGILSRKN